MNQDELVSPNEFSERLKEGLDFFPEVLRLFALMYVCDKLREELAEKAADILGHDMALGIENIIREKQQHEEEAA